jgi:hypothetical protein
MTPEDRRARTEARLDADLCREDMLLVCGGAGICNAALITLLASADAFAARLASSTQVAAELSTLQIRQLATSLAELQPSRSYRSVDVGVRSTSQVRQEPQPSAFYGAPVVT